MFLQMFSKTKSVCKYLSLFVTELLIVKLKAREVKFEVYYWKNSFRSSFMIVDRDIYETDWFPLCCSVFQVTDLDDEAGSPIEEFKAFAGDSCMNRSQSEYCNVGSKTSLTNHPAKKYVFDFMRVLIMDNLCMTPASKQTPIVDLLLEVNGLSD